jgi:ribosome-binding protein aMBF1 (putative translation factor)
VADQQDFLNEIIDESTALNREFHQLVAAAERRRALLRELVACGKARGLSQAVVAARMKTSQSAVAKLEGQDDANERR